MIPERRIKNRKTGNVAEKYCLDFLYRKYMKEERRNTPLRRQTAPVIICPNSNEKMPTTITTIHATKKRV